MTAEAVGQIHIQPSDAANTLDPHQLQLPVTQGLRISLAIRDVSKCDANVCAKGKDPHVVGATKAQRRVDLEFFSRALFDDKAAASLKLTFEL